MKTSHEQFDFEAATESPLALVDFELLEDDPNAVDSHGLEEPLGSMVVAGLAKSDFDLTA